MVAAVLVHDYGTDTGNRFGIAVAVAAAALDIDSADTPRTPPRPNLEGTGTDRSSRDCVVAWKKRLAGYSANP